MQNEHDMNFNILHPLTMEFTMQNRLKFISQTYSCTYYFPQFLLKHMSTCCYIGVLWRESIRIVNYVAGVVIWSFEHCLSGEKDLKFTINEQIPPHKDLATTLNYNGPEKFHNFVQYCFHTFKASWENELVQKMNQWYVYLQIQWSMH